MAVGSIIVDLAALYGLDQFCRALVQDLRGGGYSARAHVEHVGRILTGYRRDMQICISTLPMTQILKLCRNRRPLRLREMSPMQVGAHDEPEGRRL
jgi:hypothetical protein